MAIHEVRDESDGHRMWMNDEEYRKYIRMQVEDVHSLFSF